MHFDPDTGTTTPLRSKEEAHDYRYFPEPDLVPWEVAPAWVEEVRAALPELPAARVERFVADYGLSRYDAFVLGSAGALARFYEEVAAQGVDAKLAANWTMGEYLAHLKAAGLEPGQGHLTAERLAALVRLVADGTISGSAAKEVLRLVAEEGGEPAEVVKEHDLGRLADQGALEEVVASVVADNPAQVAQYRGGKQQVLGFFVGQVMKATQGRADAKLVNELVRKALEA